MQGKRAAGRRAPSRSRARAAGGSASTRSSCPRAATGRCCASCRSSVGRARSTVLDPLGRASIPAPLAAVLADPAVEVVAARRPPGRGDPAPRVADRRSRTSSTRRSPPGFAGFSAQAGYNGLLHDVLRIRLAEDRELHALGRAAADRRAAALRARGRRAPAAARRRDPARGWSARGRLEWAREECRGDRRRDRRARPGGGLAAAAARHRARPARARRRARAGGLARAHRRARGPAGRRGPARPDAWSSSPSASPRGRRELAQIRGINPDVVRRRGDDIIAAIERGREARADPPRRGRAARRPRPRTGR